MRERGDVLMGLLLAFVLIFPLGFIVHASPRFPGSLAGSLTGITAALLMLFPLVHVAARRIGPPLRLRMARAASPSTPPGRVWLTNCAR